MTNNSEQCTVPVCNWQNAFYVVLTALLLLVLIVSLHSRFCEYTPTATIAAPLVVTNNLDDARWQITVRDVSETIMLRSETRLRDHFSLLLVLVGVAVTIILTVFNAAMTRREERMLRDIAEARTQANDSLVRVTAVAKEADESLQRILSCENKAVEAEKHSNDIVAAMKSSTQKDKTPPAIISDKQDTYAMSPVGVQSVMDTPDADVPVEQPAPQAGEEHDLQPCVDGDSTFLRTQKAAVNGDAKAQRNLGTLYYYGNGVTQSAKKALEWYRKAAEQGDAKAQFNLGTLYYNGNGVTQSAEKALEWYRKAAEQGDAKAQLNLGTLYYNGNGVTQSAEKALEWYRKAAEQDDAEAQFNLGTLYHLGSKDFPKDTTKALEWYRKAAEQGNVKAQFNLGNLYRSGTEDFPKDIKKAFEWYCKAAEQGDVKAQFNLATMFRLGEGVPKSAEKAFEWYHKAAEQDFAEAQYALAIMYEEGLGIAQNEAKAVQWYLKAAQQGKQKAALEMTFRYFEGRGVPENYMEAYVFLLLFQSFGIKDENGIISDKAKALRTLLKQVLSLNQILQAQEKANAIWKDIQKKQKEARSKGPQHRAAPLINSTGRCGLAGF